MLIFDKVVTLSNVGAAVEFVGTPIAGLPVGDIQIFGGVLHLDVFENTAQANLIDNFVVTYSLGTTPTADNSLATTDIDLMTAKTAAAATGGVAPHQKQVLDGLSVVAGATTGASGYIA